MWLKVGHIFPSEPLEVIAENLAGQLRSAFLIPPSCSVSIFRQRHSKPHSQAALSLLLVIKKTSSRVRADVFSPIRYYWIERLFPFEHLVQEMRGSQESYGYDGLAHGYCDYLDEKSTSFLSLLPEIIMFKI